MSPHQELHDPMQDAFPGLAGVLPRGLLSLSAVFERLGFLGGPLQPLRAALSREIIAARLCLAAGDLAGAERHASRLHVLGSFYAIPHFCSHQIHLCIDWKRGSLRGVFIQALRLSGTPLTRVFVPFFGVTGHPGVSNRAAGTHWPIEEELQELLDAQPRPAPPFGLRFGSRAQK